MSFKTRSAEQLKTFHEADKMFSDDFDDRHGMDAGWITKQLFGSREDATFDWIF